MEKLSRSLRIDKSTFSEQKMAIRTMKNNKDLPLIILFKYLKLPDYDWFHNEYTYYNSKKFNEGSNATLIT